MNKNTIEITVAPCVVSRSKGKPMDLVEPIALIVASNGEDVQEFRTRETVLPGLYKALFIGLGDEGYMVACYTELLR